MNDYHGNTLIFKALQHKLKSGMIFVIALFGLGYKESFHIAARFSVLLTMCFGYGIIRQKGM